MSRSLADTIVSYVDTVETVRGPDLGFRPDHPSPLPPEYDEDPVRYLLLAASIDAGVDSGDIRYLLADISKRVRSLGRPGGLFDVSEYDAELIDQAIRVQQRSRGRLSGYQFRQYVPRILNEANLFATERAGGDMDRWAAQFTHPADAVHDLATNIHRQGKNRSEPRKKMWLFMRWLVRPKPDLWRWRHFSPSELLVPVDRHVAGFSTAAGIAPVDPVNVKCRDAETITAWAAQRWPEDPVRVDYPFYLWGRGRSNQRQPTPDTCYTVLKNAEQRCPLAQTKLCCGHRCRG
jgi:hypothetical protein